MNDVLASVACSVAVLVLCRHDEECKRAIVEHLLKAFLRTEARGRIPVELVPSQLECVIEEVLEFPPDLRSTVTNEDPTAGVRRRWGSLGGSVLSRPGLDPANQPPSGIEELSYCRAPRLALIRNAGIEDVSGEDGALRKRCDVAGNAAPPPVGLDVLATAAAELVVLDLTQQYLFGIETDVITKRGESDNDLFLNVLRLIQDLLRRTLNRIEARTRKFFDSSLNFVLTASAIAGRNAMDATPFGAEATLDGGLLEVAVVQLGVIAQRRSAPRMGQRSRAFTELGGLCLKLGRLATKLLISDPERNFHFGFLPAIQCTSNRIRWDRFFHRFHPERLRQLCKIAGLVAPGTELPATDSFSCSFSDTSRPLIDPACFPSPAAQKCKMFLSVQDLTCRGASLIHSAGLAAHVPTVAAIEANSREYVPAANKAWEARFPGLFHIKDGMMTTGEVRRPGLGAL